uniref:Uncharacterized protein n=1 Tax=Noctiluca scintillans TaxID=2966 RepID=A0A7S1F8J6_NOCSC
MRAAALARHAASVLPLTGRTGSALPVNVARCAPQWRGLAAASSGPDAPQTEDGSRFAQPRWPAGWHDHLQYHLFFEDIFVQARVFLTPSLEEHSLWIFDHAEGKVSELVNCSERMTHGDADHLDLRGPSLHIVDEAGKGSITKFSGSEVELQVDFQNKHIFSWLPAGQGTDAVFHRPDLEVQLKYKGQIRVGRGYSKRYFGHYGPHWGYRFIQSSWLGGEKFLWTACATFRLGDGEAKYNYFKLLDGTTGELVQANSEDTYQHDSVAYAHVGGERYVATVTPLGEWMHDFKAGETNSRMQLRYCRIELTHSSNKPLVGYALNERCFGVLG